MAIRAVRGYPPGAGRRRERSPLPLFLLGLVLVALLLAALAIVVLPRVAPAPAGAPPAGAVLAELVGVVDGDTIDVLLDGAAERVRYIGIDTPERGQPGYRAATAAHRALLGAGPVYLVRDISDRDATAGRRLLRYVYLAGGTHVNAELVARGWAQPVAYPPDVRFAAEFRRLAVQAAQEQSGFWAGTSAFDGAMSYALTTGPAELRKGPGTGFALTATLGQDTPLTVFGRTPERAGGWIPANAARVNVSVEGLPVR